MANSAQRQGAPHYALDIGRFLRRDLAIVVGITMLAHVVLFTPTPLWLRALTALVFFMLPGYVASTIVLRDERPAWLERTAISLGFGLGAMVLVGLALVYLPGPLTQTLVLLGFDAVLLALTVVGSQKSVVSSQLADGRWQIADGRWQMADGRWQIADGTQHSALSTQHSALSTQHSALSTQHSAPSTQHLTIVHRLSSIVYRPSSIVLLALVLAAVFRLTHLGYAEFQGDEARAMLMAAGLGQGRDEVLFVHKKGPAEVLLPALMWAATDGIDEATARLPFALAGLGVVVAIGGLGLAMSRRPGEETAAPWIGVFAALILAVDGYLVAFGRIVQYQSIVALMSILGVWCGWKYYTDGKTRWPILGAAFIAVGALGHYEAIFALPPFAFLIGRRHLRWPLSSASLRPFVAPSLTFAGVAAFFYLPFALHPHFIETVRYILDRRISGGGVGGGPLYNNLADYFVRATFYNSTWYILCLALAWVVVLGYAGWVGWRTPSSGKNEIALPGWERVGRWLAAGWPAFALLVAAFAPNMLTIGRFNLAILLFLPFLLWLLLPRLSDGFKVALLWFLGPFLVASFLVQKPHTHFYTMMPGLALLVGWGVLWYTGRQGSRGAGEQGSRGVGEQGRRGAGEQGSGGAGEQGSRGVGEQGRRGAEALEGQMKLSPPVPVSLSTCLLFLLFSGYLWLVFVRHEPEYKRVFPAARSPLYPVVYGDQPPRGGYFGFPYRAGWGVVSALYADGTLQGDYDSNEELLITGWYTRGAARCVGYPRYYFVAETVQDEEKIPLSRVEKEYHLLATVEAEGRPKLRIFSREPVTQVQRYSLADSVRLNPTEGVGFPIGQALAEAVPATPTEATFDAIRLLGYELSTASVSPGGWVTLTLFWQAIARPDSDLTVFTHIEDSQIWGQNDGWPMCGQRPTSTWRPGDVVVETRGLRLDPTTPPGEYPIRVGLYNATTGRRVPAQGVNVESDHIILGTVTVRP